MTLNTKGLRDSIPYSQFLRLIRIHNELHHQSRPEIEIYLHFLRRVHPSDTVVKGGNLPQRTPRESLMKHATVKNENSSLLLITTYNRRNQKSTNKGNYSKYSQILDRSNATWPLTNKDIMVTFKKPSSIKEILVSAKIWTHKHGSWPHCNRPATCQYCTIMSHPVNIGRHGATNSFYTIMHGNCQSSNLIYTWNAISAMSGI